MVAMRTVESFGSGTDSMSAGRTKDIERSASSPVVKTGVVIAIFLEPSFFPLM